MLWKPFFFLIEHGIRHGGAPEMQLSIRVTWFLTPRYSQSVTVNKYKLQARTEEEHSVITYGMEY